MVAYSHWKREVEGSSPSLLTLYTVKNPEDGFRECKQFAFIVDYSTLEIIFSKSGHGVYIRGRGKHGLAGGWVMPKDRKIVLFSGSLGHVYCDKEIIVSAIEVALGIKFKYIKE